MVLLIFLIKRFIKVARSSEMVALGDGVCRHGEGCTSSHDIRKILIDMSICIKYCMGFSSKFWTLIAF
jgi:hypothetical protein